VNGDAALASSAQVLMTCDVSGSWRRAGPLPQPPTPYRRDRDDHQL